MIEMALVIIVVFLILGLVVYAIQQIPLIDGFGWAKPVAIALACIVAALYLAERFLT